MRKAGQGVESGELSGYSVVAMYKVGMNIPHIVVQSTTPYYSCSRSAQNLSVSLRASLFCLCLKRRSYLIAHLSLKGIIGRLDRSLAGMMLSSGNSANPEPPYV